MRILHFSDIHLDFSLRRVPWRDWLGKRALGGGNYLWRRRALLRGGLPKVEALDGLRRQEGAELVVFSGDFSTLGTERELSAAREIVAPLIDAPAGFVCVPGNHDLYVGDTLRRRRFERHFGDLLESDLPELCADGHWPLVRLRPGLAVVAVNSARPNPWPWRSSGRIPEIQLHALERVLGHPEVAARFVFVVTHYAARLANGQPDTRHHGLRNADALLDVVAPLGERGALLCGHVHHPYRVRPRPGEPRLFCAGSSTMEGREGLWLFDVDDERSQVTALLGRWQGGDDAGWRLEPAERWSWAS